MKFALNMMLKTVAAIACSLLAHHAGAGVALAQSAPSAVESTSPGIVPVNAVQSGPVTSGPSRPNDSGDSGASAKAANGSTTPRPLALGAGDFLYLPDATGRLVPVPADTDLQQFLEWKNRPREISDEPQFSIPQLTLEGRASLDRALLTVTMQVKLWGEDWVRVPLRLDEGILRSTTHTPPENARKEASPISSASADFDRERGYRWWLRGAGVHTLKFGLLVPVRRSAGTRRLQLRLPEAAASSLKLDLALPMSRVLLPPNENVLLQARPNGNGRTALTAFGLGTQLDVNWQELPNPKQVRTVLEAETNLRVELSEETVLLRVGQLIEAVQGNATSADIWLPPGFTVSQLKVNGERGQVVESEEDKPVTVTFPEGTTGPVRLDWTLQAPLPTSRRFLISGFQVDGALRQSGEISLAAYDGYRIVKRSGTDVHRISATSQASPRDTVSAWRFWKQPFQLELELQAIEPVFAVRPLLFTGIGATEIQLAGVFEIEMFRGLVSSLQFRWPGMTAQGWTIDEAEIPASVERMRIDPETETITFDLAQPLTSGSRFTLPLVATRPTPPDGLTFDLSLPRSESSHQTHPVLVIVRDDNVDAMLMPEGETQLQTLTEVPAGWSPEKIPLSMSDYLNSRHQVYQVRSPNARFHTAVSVHERLLQVENAIEVSVDGRQADVLQQLQFGIQYGRISQLTFRLPATLPRDNYRFTMDGNDVNVEWLPATGNGFETGRILFATPRLSAARMQVRATIPLSAAAATGSPLSLSVPVIAIEGVDEVTQRLSFAAGNPAEISMLTNGWEPVLSERNGLTWETTQTLPEARLSVTARAATVSTHVEIPRMLVRSRFLHDGRTMSRAQAQWPTGQSVPGRKLPLAFPAGRSTTVHRAWWGREPLPIELISADEGGQSIFLVTLPTAKSLAEDVAALQSGRAEGIASSENVDSNSESLQQDAGERNTDLNSLALLTIDYSSQGTPFRWRTDHAVPVPQFPADITVQYIVCELVLPGDTRLLTPPSGFTPGYAWTPNGFGWHRGTLPALSNMEDWIGSGAGPELDPLLRTGNRYVLTRFGSPAELSFSTMGQSALVLIGAGLALALGLVFIKLRAIRNVVAVLFLLTAVAVIAVWFPEPVAVLAQPAAVGLLLAAMAAIVDRMVKRQRRAPVLTFRPASGVSGDSQSRPYGPIGSEDPTAVRPAPLPRPVPVEGSSAAEVVAGVPSSGTATDLSDDSGPTGPNGNPGLPAGSRSGSTASVNVD